MRQGVRKQGDQETKDGMSMTPCMSILVTCGIGSGRYLSLQESVSKKGFLKMDGEFRKKEVCVYGFSS